MPAQETYQQRLAQLQELERLGIKPFPQEPPKITHSNKSLIDGYDILSGNKVGIAGRMISKREHGGIIFAHLDDGTQPMQIVASEARLVDQTVSFQVVRDLVGRGDFIAVTGELKRTNRGEISVWADEVTMLAKALRVVPEQLLDSEEQQRRRYLHTLIDPEARRRFVTRSQIVQSMRSFFINDVGCLEVETPILDSTYGGANAKPFTTHHNALDSEFFLRIAPELYLKRLTVGGYYGGVFEFSRNFRNEGMDSTHNPEFTLLELYKPFWDYQNMMDMSEELITGIVKKLHGQDQIPFGSNMIDFRRPWRRLSVYEGLRSEYGFDPEKISDQNLQEIARGNGIDKVTKGDTLLRLFELAWDDKLVDPTFVVDYPYETSPLTKKHRQNPNLVERFELYIGGMEVANCYTELNDPRDQRIRFEAEEAKRSSGDTETMPHDEDFIFALEHGMPQQAGIGISIDRLAMVLTNTTHIRGMIYFPTLRPIIHTPQAVI